MMTWLKLAHHGHTGRLRPHTHTSYLPLLLLLGAVGGLLAVYSSAAMAAERPGPEASSIGLSGTMPGKPPTVAAVITQPAQQQRFTSSPVTISGTCPKSTLVEVFKNDIFAGSTLCSEAGIFDIEVDLLIGKNVLVARVFDDLNQPGPPSNPVTVFYDALPPQADPLAPMNFGGDQLLLNTDAVYRGVFPERQFGVPIDILGGAPPYAINVQWGDTTNKVVPRNNNVGFTVDHVYQKPGTYQISIQATDAAGQFAFLTVAAIVNGQPAAAAAPTATASVNQLMILWPLYVSAATAVISFWLGEQREKQLLRRHGQLITT